MGGMDSLVPNPHLFLVFSVTFLCCSGHVMSASDVIGPGYNITNTTEELNELPVNASNVTTSGYFMTTPITEMPKNFSVTAYETSTTTEGPTTTSRYVMTTTTEEPEYTRGPIRFNLSVWEFEKLKRYYCTASEWCEFVMRLNLGKREFGLNEHGKVKILNLNPKQNYTDQRYAGFLLNAVDSARQIDLPYENTTIFKMIRLTIHNATNYNTTHMITLDVSRPSCRRTKDEKVRDNVLKQFANALGGDVRNFTLHRHECYNNINRFILSNHTLHTKVYNEKEICTLASRMFPLRYNENIANITSLEERMNGTKIVQASMSFSGSCPEYAFVGGKQMPVVGTLNLDKYHTCMTVTELPSNASLWVSNDEFQDLQTFNCINGEYCQMNVTFTIGGQELGKGASGKEGILNVISRRKIELKKTLEVYMIGERDFVQPIAVQIGKTTIFKMIQIRVLPNTNPEPSHRIELHVSKPSCEEVQDEVQFNYLMKNVSVALQVPSTSLTVDSVSCKNNRTVLLFHKNTISSTCNKKAIHEFSSNIINEGNNILDISFMEKLAPNVFVTEATLHYTGPCSSLTPWITSVVPGAEVVVKNFKMVASFFIFLLAILGAFILRRLSIRNYRKNQETGSSPGCEIEMVPTVAIPFTIVDQSKEESHRHTVMITVF